VCIVQENGNMLRADCKANENHGFPALQVVQACNASE